MGDKQKTLVCGDVNLNFSLLFTRIETLMKKSGPFDVRLCVGNFFGEDDNSQFDAYRMGSKKVPIPTYVLGQLKKDAIKQYCEEGGEMVLTLTRKSAEYLASLQINDQAYVKVN